MSILDVASEIIAEEESKNPHLPEWVNEDEMHLSHKAYKAINKFMVERNKYILDHCKIGDFSKKKHWQITQTVIAKACGGVAPNSIFADAGYSQKAREYLGDCNKSLLIAKNVRIKKTVSLRQQGVRRGNKEEVYQKYQKEKQRADKLAKQLAEIQLETVLSQMTIQTKGKLGL